MRKLMISSMVAALAVTACQATQLGHPETQRIIGQLAESVQKGEMTKREMVIEVEALARKYSALVNAATPPDDPFAHSPDVDRCVSALLALAKFRDRHSLPLLEEIATGSAHLGLSANAFWHYFQIAGVLDALPFIERVVTNPRYSQPKRGLSIHYLAYQNLTGAIQRVNPPPPEDIPKICAFMLEKSQAEEEGIARLMDEVLAKHLPDYSSSIQRAELVEKFGDSETAYVKKYWQDAKEEIEKTPEKKRKDFRAKGELLDPERK